MSYRLTKTVAALLVIFSAYATFLILRGESWTSFFGAESSSVIFFSIVYLGAGILLAKREVPDVETFSIALATTLSAIWLYELIYHYSFPVYFNYFKFPFFDFNDTNTLLLEGATSLLVLVGYKYFRVKGNYYFWGLVSLFCILYGIWILMGFTQTSGTSYLPQYIHVNDPVLVGYILNRSSKLVLCLSWISLYTEPSTFIIRRRRNMDAFVLK